MLKLSLAIVSLLVLPVLAGCGSSSGYPQGAEKGPCYPNRTCNAGLTCLSDTCVNASPAAGTGGSSVLDGAAGAGGNAADAPLGLDLGGARDGVAPDISITGTGGTTGIDAPAVVDASQSGGGSGGSGGTTGSGGISSSGGTSSDGGLDGGSAGKGGSGSGGSGSGGTSSNSGLDGGGAGGSGGANCGLISVGASHVPADVLLVLDRSGSMDYSIAEDCSCTSASGTPVCSNTTSCTSRWPALGSAVDTTLASNAAINWGLKLYPSPGGTSCTVSSGVEVLISASSGPAIQAQIANATVGNNTPTAAAITAATAYLSTVMDGSSKAILLATDGEPNCKAGSTSSADVVGTVDAIIAAKNAGFPVYVVGIGPSVGNLDYFAQAGGTVSYYPATSVEDLVGALKAIGTAVTTCSFTLATPPPDPNNVAVYLDKSLVPEDSMNGWRFGASSQTIVFGGISCDKIISGSAASVQILFGCPGGPPPPPVLP